MYCRIRLICIIGLLVGVLMVLPAAAGHGSAGSDGQDQGPGAGSSAAQDTASPGTGEPGSLSNGGMSTPGTNSGSFSGAGINSQPDTTDTSSSGSGFENPTDSVTDSSSGAGTISYRDVSDASSSGGGRTSTGPDPSPGSFSDRGQSGNDAGTASGTFSVTQTNTGASDTLSPVAADPNKSSDESSRGIGTGIGRMPSEDPGTFFGNATTSLEKGSPATGGPGPFGNPDPPEDVPDHGSRNQNGAAAGEQGPGTGFSSDNQPDDGVQRRTSGLSQDLKTGNGGGQAGGQGMFSGSFQGMALLGTAGGTFVGMEPGSNPARPGGGSGNRGPGTSIPPPYGNPWGDSANRQVPPATTEPVPEATQPAARSKGKREEEPFPGGDTDPGNEPSGQQGSLPPGIPFLLFPFLGYRRIQKKNVLQNEGRSRIFQLIADNPGIDVVSVSDAAGMNVNTARYHLAKLIATGKITYLARPGILRYYPNQGRFSDFEQLIIHYLRNPSTAGILALISDMPGITRQEIADGLKISGPSVTRHMQQLIEDRIVTNVPEGVTNHYHLAAATMTALGGLEGKLPSESALYSQETPGLSPRDKRKDMVSS